MNSISKRTGTLLPGIVAAALSVAAARADVVTDWNVTTNALVANDVGNNPKLRTLAMVHVAMSDAINTVQNRYARVIATLPAAPSASAEAAAATAARQILTEIYPKQKVKIEEAYAASLKAIPDGPAKTEGIKLGMEVAAAVQADRANDGTNAPDTYRPHAARGHTCRRRRRCGSNMRAPSRGCSRAPTSSGPARRRHCRARSGPATMTRSRAWAAPRARRVLLNRPRR